MTTIVFCHPWHGSFNYAILQSVISELNNKGREYQIIDLVRDGFNPLMLPDDLKLYGIGETNDRLVRKYGDMLSNTNEVIFIFPLWWGMMPAVLKGFFDKVLLKGVAMDYGAEGALIPLFRIERTLLITTSQSPSSMFTTFINKCFIPHVLNSVGFNGVEWYNCEQTSHGSVKNRSDYLNLVRTLIK